MRPRWLPLMVLAAVVLSMALFLLPKRKGAEQGRVVSVTEALGGEPGEGLRPGHGSRAGSRSLRTTAPIPASGPNGGTSPAT